MQRVELVLELGERGGPGLGGEVAFDGLVETLDLSAGGRVVRSGVLLGDAQGGEGGLETVTAPASTRETGGVHESVVGEHRRGKPVLGCGFEERVDHDRAGDGLVGGH